MWGYEDYSAWARLLASSASDSKELQRRLVRAERATERAKEAHMRAVQRTTSMQGQSSRRAQTRSSMVASHEEANALRDALEIRRLFPEKCAVH